MDKRGFHKMFFGVIILIVLVLIIVYIVITPRTRESLEQLSQQKVTEIAPQPKPKVEPSSNLTEQRGKVVKEPQSDEKTLSQDQLVALDNELLPRQYHEDMYVEAQSIIAEKFLCFMVSLGPRIRSRLKTSYATSNRESQFDDSLEQCQKELNSYPLLKKEGEDLGQLLQPSSELGQMTKKLLYSKNNSLTKDFKYQSLLAVLKSKNGLLITYQASLPYIYFSEGEFIPISSWVNSQSHQYIQQLFKLSLTKLACRYQGGIACQPQGMAMTMNCMSHQPACGLDFINYYEQNILPGMQKDVDILVEKFEAMAESM